MCVVSEYLNAQMADKNCLQNYTNDKNPFDTGFKDSVLGITALKISIKTFYRVLFSQL